MNAIILIIGIFVTYLTYLIFHNKYFKWKEHVLEELYEDITPKGTVYYNYKKGSKK